MPEPIRQSIIDHDLTTRFPATTTVAASPALAAETIIATLAIPSFGDIAVQTRIRLRGWCAFTVGASGTAATLQIKQTSAAGTAVVSSGATNKTAAQLVEMEVNGNDAAPGVGVYVLTLTVANGAAVSTVSAVSLAADII